MKWNGKTLMWSVLALVILIGLAGIIVPEIDAGRMRQPLAGALEQTLGRRVEFGEVRYQVFPTPGLSARDLVIPEDPAFGLEPVAYVGEFQAGVSFASLLTGRLNISSVRLVDASVNLARKDEVGWNFGSLLERIFAGVRQSGSGPRVEMRQSRINFRTGTLKSALFLNAVDLDLEPPASPGGDLLWRYEASPARTDRAEQGFGRFTGSGRWMPGAGGGRLAVDLELERSAFSELLTLVTGNDLGVQGRFTSRATLDGPLNRLSIRGSLELEDVDRPGFFGLRAREYSMPYEGSLDLAGQTLDLSSTKPEGAKAALPFSVGLICRRMLVEPQWEASLAFDGIPAPALLDVARRLGARMPEGLAVEGELVGLLKYSQVRPSEGTVTLMNGSVSAGGSAPLSLPEAQLALAGTQMTLAAAEAATPEGLKARVSGRWDVQSEALDFEMQSERIPLNDLLAAAGRLHVEPPPPLDRDCRDGEVGGTLAFHRAPSDQDGETEGRDSWTGELQVRRAVCVLEGAAQPVRLQAAVLSLKKTGWALRHARAAYGAWTLSGELAHAPGPGRPYRFSLVLEQASGAELHNFLKAALLPRRGFLDRTLRRKSAPPSWLRARHAEGELRIQHLELGGKAYAPVVARIYWDGAHLEMPDVAARGEDSQFSGRAAVLLGGEQPRYRLLGKLDGYASAVGSFDAEIDVTTRSLASPLAGVLAGTAQIAGRNIDLGDEKARLLNACLDYDGARAAQRLKIGCLEAQVNGDWLPGQVSPAPDGRFAIEFPAARHAHRLVLSLSPPEIAPAAR